VSVFVTGAHEKATYEVCMMIICASTSHISHDLNLVSAYVLPKVFMMAEVLPASFDRTLAHCDRITQVSPFP